MSLTPNEVLEQSKAAMRQWEQAWRSNATKNGELYRKHGNTQHDLLFAGVGRKLLCVAFSPSLELEIDNIKNNINESVDIACCDKCVSFLIKHGLKPKYVFIADAGISYEQWAKPIIDDTEDIILLANVTSNTDWTHNWKGKVYFYVNKDNIQTEKIFSELSGCNEQIPASSNVGNTVVVFSTQIFGYDEYLLIGYDFCWADDENYYAFFDSEKRYWMKHMNIIDNAGRLVQTSQNLLFSARWLNDFYSHMNQTKGIKIFNLSQNGILGVPRVNLERKLKSSKIRKISDAEKNNIIRVKRKQIVVTEGQQRLTEVLNTHNITEVIVNYIPNETKKWLEAI